MFTVVFKIVSKTHAILISLCLTKACLSSLSFQWSRWASPCRLHLYRRRTSHHTERSIADPSETVFQWEMNCATWSRMRGDCALFRIKKRALRPFRRICTRPASIQHACRAVENGLPIVVVNHSGRGANLLTLAFKSDGLKWFVYENN